MTSKEKILENIKNNNKVKVLIYQVMKILVLNLIINLRHSLLCLKAWEEKHFIDKKQLDVTIKSLYPDEKQIASNVDFFVHLEILMQTLVMMLMIKKY